MNDLGVLLHLIFIAREHADKDSVVRLEASESSPECSRHALLFNSSRSQNFECETRLSRLSHHSVHSRRIALQVDFARHLQDFTAQKFLPLLRGSRAVVYAAGVEVDIPALFFYQRND